jgi:hypothetical protein
VRRFAMSISITLQVALVMTLLTASWKTLSMFMGEFLAKPYLKKELKPSFISIKNKNGHKSSLSRCTVQFQDMDTL